MAIQFSSYVGVDAATGRKPFTFVALDPALKLLAVGHGSAVDMLSFAAGQNSALIALSPPWRSGSQAENAPRNTPLPVYRLGGLRQLPFQLDGGPVDPESSSRTCPAWISATFDLSCRLQDLGYQFFPSPDAARQWMEVPAESGYHSLLGIPAFSAGTLEGRIQRQLVLFDLDLPVPDAMGFFEEITRFKLLHGHLPSEKILPQAELNAWLAACTAWLAVHAPERVRRIGEPETGQVYLPVNEPAQP